MLSHSRLQTFDRCRRAYWLKYVANIHRERQSDALRIGSAVHEGLDVLFKTGDTQAAVAHVHTLYVAKMSNLADEQLRTEIMYEAAMVTVLLQHYAAYWDEPMETVASELEFHVALDSGQIVTGFIDKVVRLSDGRLAKMEHKTTSLDIEPGSDYWAPLAINGQVSLYVLAARTVGHPIECVLYDVIRKPGERPKHVPVLDEAGMKIVVDQSGERLFKKDGQPYQAADKAAGRFLRERMETPDEYAMRLLEKINGEPEKYFQRKEITRSSEELEEYRDEIEHRAAALASAHETQAFFRNPDACCRPGMTCEYLPICARGTEALKDGTLPDGFVRRATEDAVPQGGDA